MAGKMRYYKQQEGEAIANLEPDQMREYLLSHPLSEGGRLWCDRVIEGVARGDRTDKRLFAEAMRWTGAQINIANVFLERFNVPNEDALVRMVESGKRFEQIRTDVEDSWEKHLDNGVALLKAVLQRHPERRASVVAELGGVLPITNGGAK